MPTANRQRFVPQAIQLFLAQDYSDKELIILDDGEDSIADLIPAHPQVRYLRRSRRRPVGAKRNLACAEARGEIIVHWDDDDWYSPWRLSYQVQEFLQSGCDVCGLDRVLFLNAAAQRAWEYVYPKGGTPWVCGATLCYQKAFWRRNPFPEINIGEDTRFIFNVHGAHIRALPENGFFVGLIHDANTSPKQTRDPRWQPRPVETIQALMGSAWALYTGERTTAIPESRDRPAALVSAASGIGDILRVTPLIRVLHRLGYQVDVLLASDYPEAIDLLRGAPEVRRIIYYPEIHRNRGAQPVPELDTACYELATYTTWSAPLARWVKSKQRYAFSQGEWLSLGDMACVEKIARAIGWRGSLPEPFAMTSKRAFDLPAGTIALHPGCKPNWPWKKWHGFDGLARLLPNVVLLGSEADLDNSQTYFDRAFEWPGHVRNFVGQLSLADTAALISQCAALISNDSGLMHLGVALGVPTFGIFGITSPQREIIQSRWMTPVTKGLPCEPACRQKAWGRRDCEHHLECLKTLTPDEVASRLRATLPEIQVMTPDRKRGDSMKTISLNYYGWVFDASGYGQAARAYIQALHSAGIRVSVVDLGSQPRQVEDKWVVSLLGKDPGADFQLFHGIPPQWAHLAYPLRHVIAMTVWETDTLPQRWRNPLSHAIDVWLPCTFNVEVFSRGLGRPAFRLPHAMPATGLNGANYPPLELDRLGLMEGDFIFYSIFEWQERKNPKGMIEAFLRAFPQESDAILVLKTNPGASAVAMRTLEEARTASGSRGRVVLCCEAWNDAQLQALHSRGSCYVSLHKGEGWGYPLFEAACRGKPVVATAYSGPLDYLNPQGHWLVRQSPAPVRQPYIYYHPSMRWAEPDISHGTEGMRWIYEHREQARAGSEQAARQLSATYSPELVGAAAKRRLLELLKQANPSKWKAINRQERLKCLAPNLPIPGEWYDADYFEYGLKSNWDQGYTWPLFKGVFEAAAAYLAELFPEAQTFLDIGCAKGFLVRALRARGLEAWGFDHSPWAISQAEAAAKPFVCLADIDTVNYDCQFDILVAMSIFESLTEEQLRVVLPRIQPWARQMLFATIPTLEVAPRAPKAWEDRDLSHITLRDRAWWRERFLDAGWHQDATHQDLEQRCQAHPLPVKMGWSVYVFSPGQ